MHLNKLLLVQMKTLYLFFCISLTTKDKPDQVANVDNMREQTALEWLLEHSTIYGHILQQIFLHLDSQSLKNLRLASKKLNSLVLRNIWKNSRALTVCRERLRNRYSMHRIQIE